LGLFEIIIILVVALIVLGPERMPEVVRMAVQILREVRTAANEAMREITEALEQENPPQEKPPEHQPVFPDIPADRPAEVAADPPAEVAADPPADIPAAPPGDVPPGAPPDKDHQ
jgi:sec-independent protein translocase protein TatB